MVIQLYELRSRSFDRLTKPETNSYPIILEVRSLDQLKDKILKVIVVVLVVSFFKRVMAIEVESATNLLYLAVAILLISASSYLLRSSHES